MFNFKRFIFNRLFNENQRRVIWKAVLYSEELYKRRGNVDKAAEVRLVINEVARIAALKQRTFLEGEVQEIVQKEVKRAIGDANQRIVDSYRRGIAQGVKKTIKEVKKAITDRIEDGKESEDEMIRACPIEGKYFRIIKGVKIDLEKCEKCPYSKNCFVYSAISEIEVGDGEGAEDKAPEEPSQEQEQEQGKEQEGAQGGAEDKKEKEE